MADLHLSDFFSTFGINFYEEIAGLKPAKVFALVCYTYGWSYGCCLVVQDVSGRIWAVEEVTETKKRVSFISIHGETQNYFLFFYGVHTPAKFDSFKKDVALLTAIHYATTVTDELYCPNKSQCAHCDAGGCTDIYVQVTQDKTRLKSLHWVK